MIRDVQESDARAIAEIYNYYIENTVVTFEEETIDEDDVLNRIRKVKKSGYIWLVAVDQDKVIGYAYSSSWRTRAAFKNTVEISVYLACNSKKKGWGTQLYHELFSRLEKHNVHIAIGAITLPNNESVELHKKFGMKKVAHFEEVGFKFGKWLDVGFWQKKI